jgi:rod shape-determining protein MreD
VAGQRANLFSFTICLAVGAGAIVSLYFAVPFLTLVALAEATLLPHVRVGGAQPDLTLLMVGAWSLRRGIEEGAMWAFVGGIVLDLLSVGPFSASMLALLAASLVLGIDPSTGVGRRQARHLSENPLALIVGVILATLAFHLVLITMLRLAGHPINWLDAGVSVIVPRAIFNLILMPLIYRPLGWLDRRTRREEFVM